jgi:hypothetical protein
MLLFEKVLLLFFADIEVLTHQLDFYQRAFYYLRGRNRDLIRRNNSLKREVRHLRSVIEDHEDFIFGPILFGQSQSLD